MKQPNVVFLLFMVFLESNQACAQKSKPLLLARTMSEWDGSVWQRYDSSYHYYDAEGRLLISRDDDDYRWQYAYDEKNNLIWEMEEHPTQPFGLYEKAQRTTYVYDSKNNMITRISQAADDKAVLVNNEKRCVSYDVNNRKVEEVDYVFDIENGYFVKSYKSTYSCDKMNKLINELEVAYTEDSTRLESDRYKTFTYDSKNNQTIVLVQWRDTLTKKYETSYRQRFTYGKSGNKILTETLEFWSDSLNSFVPRELNIFKYDDKQNILGKTRQIWNKKTKVFETENIFTKKYEYTYENGNMTSELEKGWDAKSNTLVNRYLFKYYYQQETSKKKKP